MSDWKKVFAIIWTGQLFSTLSSAIVGYAVVFWLSVETKSAEVLALATIAALLPQLIIGPFTGVYIDRWNRRKIMILADLFIAACSFIMALLFLRGHVPNYLVYFLLALRSIGAAFHVPAMQASVPLLAPESELTRINGINQVIQSVSTIAGPALAALFISVFNMTLVLMTDVAGAIIAIVSLLFVYIPDPGKKKDAPEPHFLRELNEGLREIYIRPAIMWIFIVIIVQHFFIMPVAALFPLLTINHFSGSTYQMSIVEVGWGLGTLAGGAILGIRNFRLHRFIIINLTFIILGLTFAFSGILPQSGFWIFVALTFFGGISMAVYSGVFMTVMQTTIEPSALGRVLSFYGSFTLLPSMIGLLQTGFIADSIGVPNAFVISGTMIVLVGICSFFIPAIRGMILKGK